MMKREKGHLSGCGNAKGRGQAANGRRARRIPSHGEGRPARRAGDEGTAAVQAALMDCYNG